MTVTVVGGTSGSITDSDGWFRIRVPDVRTDLEFRFVGYEPQTVAVGNRTMLNVALRQAAQELEQVVVVGYGVQKKMTMTGSVASVNARDIRTPAPNLSNTLQGKVSGVISVQTSGEPGYDNSMFTIRGIGTFVGSNSPLIIVDGVQRDDVNSNYAGSYNNIDTEDIASISLLKDASATAVYGAKGANGVLIITTKRGIAGKPQISLKAEAGFTGFTKIIDMLDGPGYMTLYNEGRRNAGMDEKYSLADIRRTASGMDPYLFPNVNWIDQIYRDAAFMSNVNLNVTGGGEAVRYYVSASFYDQEGQYRVRKTNGFNPNLSFKRYDFRSNIDANITKTTLLQMNIGAMLVDARYPAISSGNLWYLSLATTPVGYPVRYPDGRWAGAPANGGANPKSDVQNNGYSNVFKPTIQSVFTINQELDFVTEGLSAYVRFAFDSYGEFNNSRSGSVELWNSTGRDENGELIFVKPVREGTQFLGYGSWSTGERVMYLEGNILYDRKFADAHSLNAMFLYNMRNRRIGTAGDAISSIPFRNQAFAGRVGYGYKDKYLVEFNASYTGSENFAPGYKFGFFPAVSAGWVVSNESFFKSATDVVSLLKVRGSYGVVGNDNIGLGNRFGYLTQIGGGNSYGFGPNGSGVGGIKETVLGVESLTWEKSYKSNVGLELGLFQKLNLTVDYFREFRNNILIQRSSLPAFAGLDYQIFANMGEMQNNGFDANIAYDDQFGKFGLRLYGNVSYSVNKVLFRDEPDMKYAYQSATGRKYDEWFGYIAEGLFVDQRQIDNSPRQFGGVVMPGDIKYKDVNEDGVIDSYDQVYLGKTAFPAWSYGAGINLSYRNFDLSLFFQGAADVHLMANGGSIAGGSLGSSGVGIIPFTGIGQYPSNGIAKTQDRWTEEHPRQDAWYPRLRYNDDLNSNNYRNSTWWLKDASYLRLKQASLGYSLNTAKLRKAGIGHLYFYVSGQNLLTFSRFRVWDPEQGSNAAGYPLTRMVVFGVRARF